MKNFSRKLVLRRDTVRALDPADLNRAAGGLPNTQGFCPPEPLTRIMDGCPATGTPPCATNWTCINICQIA